MRRGAGCWVLGVVPCCAELRCGGVLGGGCWVLGLVPCWVLAARFWFAADLRSVLVLAARLCAPTLVAVLAQALPFQPSIFPCASWPRRLPRRFGVPNRAPELQSLALLLCPELQSLALLL